MKCPSFEGFNVTEEFVKIPNELMKSPIIDCESRVCPDFSMFDNLIAIQFCLYQQDVEIPSKYILK